MKKIFIIVWAFFLFNSVHAQEQKELESNMWGKLRQADEFYDSGNFNQAVILYEEFIQLNETFKNEYFYFKVADSYFYLKRYQEAIQYFTKALVLIKFNRNNYDPKKLAQLYKSNWKNKPGFNIFDSFKDIYIVKFNDSTNLYEMVLKSGETSINTSKSDAIFKRAICKIRIKDFYGAISDIRKYHKIIYDSNSTSNYMMGRALMETNQMKLAKKYFNAAISMSGQPGPYNDDEEVLKNSYYYRGFVNGKLGNKIKACEDLSKAGELGKNEAYEAIKINCQFEKVE